MSFVDDFFAEQQNARESVVGIEDDNPEQAARAIQVSQAIGVPSIAVVQDLPGFERQAKNEMATTIINDNPALQEYINSNPMAARVSSDDWGNLDGITKRVAGLSSAINSTLIKTVEAYGQGVRDQGHIGSWLYNTPEKAEQIEKMGPVQARYYLMGWTALGLPIEALSRVLGPVPETAKTFIQESYGHATGDHFTAARLGREAAGFVEYVFNKPPVLSGPGPFSAMLANKELRALADSTGPYIRAGQEPPIGLHPALDDLKKEQTKRDLQELNDLTTEVQQSTTRARSPELFADMLRMQTQANIYIPFEGVVKMYGEKPIKPDDNVLGWVPGIQEQVRTMSLTGGDIVIPLADWLAKSDKAVAKDLHDFIRVRRGGFTIEEAKADAEVRTMADIDVYHGSPHSFDAFSMEKIGTGEGAQSYGHGLYFAQNKDVADSYRQMGYKPKNQNEAVAVQALRDAAGNAENAMAQLATDAATFVDGSAQHREHRAAYNLLKRGWTPDEAGNMYRARIRANPEEFLDWDKSLQEQTPAVQERLRKLGYDFLDESIRPEVKETIRLELENVGGSVNDAIRNMEKKLKAFTEPERIARYQEALQALQGGFNSGSTIYRGLTENNINRGAQWGAQQMASTALREAGIPGIRYLDQGSRMAEAPEQLIARMEDVSARLDEIKALSETERTPQIYKEFQDLTNERQLLQNQIKEAKKLKQTYNYVLFDDALVEILDRNGEAIQAVRQQAKFDTGLPITEQITSQISITLDNMSGADKIMYRAVDDLFARILPDWVRTVAAHEVNIGDTPVQGVYQSYEKSKPLIIWSMKGDSPMSTGRHEAVHFLREYGFFTTTEWETLRTAAIEGDWLKKYNIEGRYKDLAATPEALIEEAIAEEYSKTWARQPGNVQGAIGKIFEKLHIILVEVKQAIQKALGKDITPEQIFEMIESGEMKSRSGTERLPREMFEDPKATVNNAGITIIDDFLSGRSSRSVIDVPEGTMEILKGKRSLPNNPEPVRSISIIDIEFNNKGSGAFTEYLNHVEQKVSESGFWKAVYIQNVINARLGKFLEARGYELDWDMSGHPSYFKKIEEREPKAAAQGELDVTRQADKAIFDKANAIGMTVPQYKRYLQLIEKRNLEDIQAQRERAIALEKKRQSTEWKQESEAIEDEVRSDLRNRPDVAATEFFRYGELYGEKIDGPRPKLDESLLTPEERKLLPPQWIGTNGLHPDDAAGLFGYSSKAELIERIAQFEAQRGNIRPGEFLSRLVKAEVERRMVEKYGELDQNILSAAEDHVLGTTQMDLLHEETLALGTRSGAEISFTKEDVQAWAETRFNEANADKVSAVRFLDDAGRAGRQAELALLKGDFTEAFRHKQAQYLSALMAREAKGFEKETKRFERLAQRYSRREGPKNIDQHFTDQIQALLLKAELPVRRTGEELAEAFDRAGYGSLDEFVSTQSADGWELAVQPYLAGQIKKAENMSVQEAREFRTAITSLNHVGREARQIELAGVKEDFDAFKEKVLENIKTLPFRPKETQGRWFYKWDAMQTKMEEIVKDLDLRQQLGPLFDALIRPMAEAKHQEYSMLETLAKKFSELRGANKEWQKTLEDAIPQTFFFDPNGTVFDITRQDMIGMMLNFGNKSNIDKFVKGWKGKEDGAMFQQKLQTMFDQNATKADWDFVQNIWDVFEMWRKDANEMYYQLSGVPPKWIDAQPITNIHGNYRGGYFPVIYDKFWSGIEAKASSRADVMFGQNYHRATPANHYTKERSGYVDFVEFQGSIEQVAARMQQEIHDISYRRPLIAAKKVITDKEIRGAIRQHYGSEYEAQLTPWMQKIASHYQMDEQAVQGANAFLRRIRYNLIGHALPLNLKVLLSPSTGLVNPISFGSMLWNRAANEKTAMAQSKEIPHTFRNMDRDFRERLEATINAKGFNAFQADVLRATFWPAVFAEQQFRIKTFATEYQNNLVKGMSDGDAAAAADSIVRERHGSAGLPDLPAIMSSNEAMKAYTLFYGFFNTMYNWQRQMPGQVRRGEYSNFLKTLYGTILVPSAFGALLFNQQKENDSWFKTIGKALLLQPIATAVFAREIGSALIEGFPSRTGLGGLLGSIRTSAGDIEKMIKNKEVKKPIQHTANVVGLTTGLPLAQIGRTSQFAYDVNKGKQRPRNFAEWFRGIVTGEARLKK